MRSRAQRLSFLVFPRQGRNSKSMNIMLKSCMGVHASYAICQFLLPKTSSTQCCFYGTKVVDGGNEVPHTTRTRDNGSSSGDGKAEFPGRQNPTSQDHEENDGPAAGHYDPWAVLGLKPGVAAHDLRIRYHELLKKYHPDYVPAGTEPNLEELHKVEQAYQFIAKSPTLDKKFRNLVTDTQHAYYKILPQWMARNIDEMPRYWTWFRWKVQGVYFWVCMAAGCFLFGKLAARYPNVAFIAAVAFLCDVMLHTVFTPAVVFILFLKGVMGGEETDMSWFHSPKTFLSSGLTY